MRMELVEYEVKGKIANIKLNRPDKLNAINLQMFHQLVAAFRRYDEDSDAWVCILSGKGRSFCAGHDQEENTQLAAEDLFLQILNLTKPLIVAVQGHCLGMALAVAFSSDIRIGAEGSKYGWPNVRWGQSSIGGPAFMPHYLPRNYACEYMFTGDLIKAEEAFRLALLNRIVPPEKLMSTAQEIAAKISGNAPLAVRAMKEATFLGFDLPMPQRLAVSRLFAGRVAGTEDAKEGLKAFIEKRKPVWKGK